MTAHLSGAVSSSSPTVITQERIDVVRKPAADSLELAVPAAFGEPLVLDDAKAAFS
jgi:hypothetical protein